MISEFPSQSRYLLRTAFLFVFIGVGGSSLFAASKGISNRTTSCDAALNISGVDLNPATNVDAIDIYKKTIAQLFKEEKFKEIDCIASEVRSKKSRFSGGNWKLHMVYEGIRQPLTHATEKDWTDHLARLKRWTKVDPSSITARVALADAYTAYAFDARGEGPADTVSQNGWQLFSARLKTARQVLEEAEGQGKKDPEWFIAMQAVAQYQQWSLAEATALLKAGLKFEPDYYYLYRMHEHFLSPKWGGHEGDQQRFLDNAADSIGGTKGDILYFQASSCECLDESELEHLSWTRLKSGYAAIEKEYGSSLINLNHLAYLAVQFRDSGTAYKSITELKGRWDNSTWGSLSYFQKCKAWAEEGVSKNATVFPMRQVAESNEHTPEGARYKELIESQLASLIRACVPDSAANLEPFELLIGVGAEGLSTETMRIDHGPVSNCLIQKFRTTIFPAPPQPHYWLRFEIDPGKERQHTPGIAMHEAK